MTALDQRKEWYWEVIMECDKKHYELLSFYLFEAGATGIQEVSDSGISICIKAFFSSDIGRATEIGRNLQKISDTHQIPTQLQSVSKNQHVDWSSGWRAHFKPLPVGDNFLVRPPWETPQTHKLEIIIDPGQGFGTGYHPSTVIALRLLEWLHKRCRLEKALDVGAGSGILSIGALLLGVPAVTAIDIDVNVMKEIRKNLILSGMDEKRCEIFHKVPQQLKADYDLVLANIENHVLLQMMSDFHRLIKKSQFLILSGILFESRFEFSSGIPPDMQVIKELQIEDWWGIALRKE